jgi:murein DD-endopeptidase MepM/ murein hydrolase activator NlpD
VSRLLTVRSATALALAVLVWTALSPSTAAANEQAYRIQPGDTLSGLAQRFGTTTSELASRNQLANRHRIVAGRTLTVPAPAPAPALAPAAAGAAHVLRPGESLSVLAQRFGTTVDAIARLNGVTNPHRVMAGRRLLIPGPGGGPRHRVASGDTLSTIAARHGISQADLARWNGIVSSRIYATTGLLLYDPGPLPSATVVCPVPGATFFNDWAFPRPAGRFHNGNDLFAPRGTPVRAPASGTVEQAHGTVGGLHVWLTDAAGNRWLGSHLDRFGASGRVSAGDVIGYVGDTGNARGARPHLHLEYHPAGRGPVNPYPLLRQIC